MSSIDAVGDVRRKYVYRQWFANIKDTLPVAEFNFIRNVYTVAGRSCPFLAPCPTRSLGVFAEELKRVSAVEPEMVRNQLRRAYGDADAIPVAVRSLYEQPEASLLRLVNSLSIYWKAAIEPVWLRLEALCSAELSHRMDQLLTGGLEHVLNDIHPSVSFVEGNLAIGRSGTPVRTSNVTDAGFLLVPTVFSWPDVTASQHESGCVVLSYPPRGVGELLTKSNSTGAGPLCALIGRTRASLLARLDLPATTTQLAHDLNISPAAVSQHLQILKAARLVRSRRRGRSVLYELTAAAVTLMDGTPSRGATRYSYPRATGLSVGLLQQSSTNISLE